MSVKRTDFEKYGPFVKTSTNVLADAARLADEDTFKSVVIDLMLDSNPKDAWLLTRAIGKEFPSEKFEECLEKFQQNFEDNEWGHPASQNSIEY